MSHSLTFTSGRRGYALSTALTLRRSHQTTPREQQATSQKVLQALPRSQGGGAHSQYVAGSRISLSLSLSLSLSRCAHRYLCSVHVCSPGQGRVAGARMPIFMPQLCDLLCKCSRQEGSRTSLTHSLTRSLSLSLSLSLMRSLSRLDIHSAHLNDCNHQVICPFTEICGVSKKRTALVVPNAIEITTKEKSVRIHCQARECSIHRVLSLPLSLSLC